MSKRDYYETLAVEKNAGEDELKKAYRRLAVQFHPDRNPGDKAAEERFKEINEAYQILSDPQKRAAYDRLGHAAFGQGGFGGAGFEQGFGSFSDIFDNIFGDIFGNQRGGGAGQGVDLRYNLELTFEEAAFGLEKELEFERDSICDTCHGSGAKPGTQPKACKSCRGTGQVRFNQGFFTMQRSCPQCQGRGAVVEEKCKDCRGAGKTRRPAKVPVKIPAGIDSEQRLRLRGEGEIAEPGGVAGDLYVVIRVKEHPLFQRQNEHILLELPITFVQAALGAEVEVPTLGGTTKVKLSHGTQNGETIRLKGKGIKRLNGTGSGDQLVRVVIETPTSLTSRQKEILREFEKEGSRESQPIIASYLKKFKELFNA